MTTEQQETNPRRYRFRVGEEVLFGYGAAFVVVIEHLPCAESGEPRYFVQFEDGVFRPVREHTLTRDVV